MVAISGEGSGLIGVTGTSPTLSILIIPENGLKKLFYNLFR
jgi:hypothetical protein